ncbi:MAG: OmpH family outer membrane protein [Bacteroidales bacterium]|nr:OmpH family outer membrane protein [Bacteroidales bacterium]
MKNSIKILLTLVVLFLGFTVQAQSQIKLGHINSQELMAAMPESDSAQKTLEATAQQIEQTMEQLQVEFNQKYETYANNLNTYTDLVRATKESELQDLQDRIQQFQQTAQQEIQKQRNKLFQPIRDKATKFINQVAEENGFTYIFDVGSGAIVYAAEGTVDILPMVKTKMGIK